MSGAPLRVVKVGGSLLEMEGLAPAICGWLKEQPPLPTVLIAGGGALADFVRRADGRHQIGETAAHWMCVRLMGVTARILAAMLPEAELTDSFSRLRGRLAEEDYALLCVFDCERFLRDVEPRLPGEPLPHNWQVTSDSIAARIAETLAADELVLLKSADPTGDQSPRTLAEADYVDEYFPEIAGRLHSIRYVNLRRRIGCDSLHSERCADI